LLLTEEFILHVLKKLWKNKKKQLEQEVLNWQKTLIDLGIHNMHHELVRLIGKMRFRSSYWADLLQIHGSCTTECCDGAELGLNPKLAKKSRDIA
jgi:ribonuclease Y